MRTFRPARLLPTLAAVLLAAVPAAAEETAERTPGEAAITYITATTVYLDAGSEALFIHVLGDLPESLR